MSVDLEAFARRRPYLFHLTARANLARVQRSRRLEPAAALYRKAGRPLPRHIRRESEELLVDGDVVVIRDQAPLHVGNIQFEGGWTIEDLLQDLNRRVFFWPGTADGPSAYGQRHFARYEAERPVVLRVPTEDVVRATAGRVVELCRYNSGSPRCSGGKKSSRGPGTFQRPPEFTRGVSEVVEVAFPSEVGLPSSTSVGEGPAGPWVPLFGQDKP